MAIRSEARDIERIPIDSSNLHAIGYRADGGNERGTFGTLAVEFKSGDIFHYRGVSQELFDQFCLATSRGRFYSLIIKGKFTADKMTGLCPKCGAHGLVGERCEDCGCADVLLVDKSRKDLDERPVVGWTEADQARVDALAEASYRDYCDDRDREEVDRREEPTGEGRY